MIPKPPKHLPIQKKIIAAIILIGLFVVLGTKKILQYALAPSTPKDCDFVFPGAADQTKPTSIVIDDARQLRHLTQRGGVINDASCLNKTGIYGIVNIASVEDVKNALKFAKDNKLKVTAAGQRHSMGGQSFVKDGLVLDMHGLDGMKVDEEKKVLTVGSGATWEQVQQYLDKRGLAVKAMQSINIFTVGGTLSVNAHGIAHDPGQIAPTVRSLTIMTADGSVQTASPTENTELFRSVLGGYGLFGVILEAELDVVPNEMYERESHFMDYREFPEFYQKNIDQNDALGLLYGRISVAPQSYLRETVIHTYTKVPDYAGELPQLQPDAHTWLNRLIINFSKTGDAGRWTRWMLEKYVESKIHTCTRNQAMNGKEACLVSRNQEMYDAMGYLKNRLPDTDILQEYFIPVENMPAFIDDLRETVKTNGANLLNVTIRIVHEDTITSLPYAKGDRIAFVLYFNQRFNNEESEILKKTTVDLIDIATSLGGTYYLPYQLFYSPEQLRKAYPEIDSFFATKKKHDPDTLFTNTFFEKYGPRNEM